MIKILFGLLFTFPLISKAQSITADPSVEPMKITTSISSPILVNELPLFSTLKLKVPIQNKNIFNGLPYGSCKVKIGLGSKLILSSTLNLSLINTSNYFHWTAISSGGQVQITGDLIGQLPANYSDTAYFDVLGSILGSSTITTNFLVTNHNTNITLSDENGSNNLASIAYTIVANVLPVTFTNIYTEKKDCSLKVIFDTENQINVDKYELEVSNDLNTFERVSSTKATNLNRYYFNFNITDKYQVHTLLIRIKSIDVDGTYQYSEIKKVSGNCSFNGGVLLYPNPIPENTNLICIKKNNGFFNGIYNLTLLDATGKTMQNSTLQLVNKNMFYYDTKNLLTGQYIIKISNLTDYSFENLKIIKQ